MSWLHRRWMVPTLTCALSLSVAACSADDAPLGPSPVADIPTGQQPVAQVEKRVPDFGGCDSLRTPHDVRLTRRLYAKGVQIYSWNGTNWTFVAPSADLFTSARFRGLIGTHYAGPTWEDERGSKVIGAVTKRCTPDPSAIPWLLLDATSNGGHGIFERVTRIQRIDTEGGLAPSQPGSTVGETASVPYTAVYLFYQPR